MTSLSNEGLEAAERHDHGGGQRFRPGRLGLPRLRARHVLEVDAGAMTMWGLRAGRGWRYGWTCLPSQIHERRSRRPPAPAPVPPHCHIVLLDDRSIVEGLTGTVFGPARVAGAEGVRELGGRDLEVWLNERGTRVKVLIPARRSREKKEIST
ncbi:hypothetical protein GCM10018787_54370 [Streptomyces thermodiastaticus]|nr:hypothetical protein GCM10018787_54370 [Streptomyces thermodiastaticus]